MNKLLLVLCLLLPVAVFAEAVNYAELKPEYFNQLEDGTTFNDQLDGQTIEFKVVNRKSEKGVKIKSDGRWLKHGAYHLFSSRKLKRTTRYVAGKKHGEEVIYRSSDGSLLRKTDWAVGEKDGLDVQYHKNGNKSQEMDYVNGQKHGRGAWYDSDGSLSTERGYENNVQHGLMKHYDKGRLTHTQLFTNGKGGKTNWVKH